ncbi:hypothetical protein AB1K83_10505 [Sporosarcina sp. 179-K 3D1 HS]|uniref:hypothetical protein n=1 Tax=Sporosarcina sp. 179-K 3D1 HS TaxID=3232169 RepID=UPI0039A12E5C
MMERQFIDSTEMELRKDEDYIASLGMVGEGAPDHGAFKPKRAEPEGFDEEDLPAAYQ